MGDTGRAGPPSTAEASSSGRSRDVAWVEDHEGEVQESGTALQDLKPAVAGVSSCQVNVANLMEVLSPCRCRAGATEIGAAAEPRRDSAPPARRLIPTAAARPPHPAPRNLRSSRCSPEVLGPHGEREDKVDICNIAELMKPPSPHKPAPPSS